MSWISQIWYILYVLHDLQGFLINIIVQFLLYCFSNSYFWIHFIFCNFNIYKFTNSFLILELQLFIYCVSICIHNLFSENVPVSFYRNMYGLFWLVTFYVGVPIGCTWFTRSIGDCLCYYRTMFVFVLFISINSSSSVLCHEPIILKQTLPGNSIFCISNASLSCVSFPPRKTSVHLL